MHLILPILICRSTRGKLFLVIVLPSVTLMVIYYCPIPLTRWAAMVFPLMAVTIRPGLLMGLTVLLVLSFKVVLSLARLTYGRGSRSITVVLFRFTFRQWVVSFLIRLLWVFLLTNGVQMSVVFVTLASPRPSTVSLLWPMPVLFPWECWAV